MTSGLVVEHVSLRGVRTYERLELVLGEGLHVMAGPNGAGKTNLLEAIAFGCLGASPRTSSELRLVHNDDTFCRSELTVSAGGERHVRAAMIEIVSGKKFTIDGSVQRTAAEFAASAPVVTFLPERLLVMRGAPARRRALIDAAVVQLQPRASAIIRTYTRALTQRNALLRRAKSGADVTAAIAPWTQQLVEAGSEYRSLRAQGLSMIEPSFQHRLEQLTGFTDGSIQVNIRGDDLAAALNESWPADCRRGSTTQGPHLDDITFTQGSRNLRSYGSTGEQRASLLAWSLAQSDAVSAQTGVRPLLLLDEPYAELDRSRRRRLSDSLAGQPQVLVTTTEPPQHIIDSDAQLHAVASGSVAPWTTTTT